MVPIADTDKERLSSEVSALREQVKNLERKWRGLQLSRARDQAFWSATNHNLRLAYARLDRTDARLARAQRLARIGDWERDLVTQEMTVSAALLEILGLQPNEFSGTHQALLARVHRADRAAYEHVIEQAIRTGQSYDVEHRIVTPRGITRWVRHQGVALTDGMSRPVCLYGAIQDITERIDFEARLRMDAQVLDNLEEGIVILDADGCIVEVNRAFTRITGFPKDDVVGRDLGFMYRGAPGPVAYEEVRAASREHGRWQGEISARRKDGSKYPQWLTVAASPDALGTAAYSIASFSDITVLKEAQIQLEQMAYHDAVTGLPNRRFLSRWLQDAIQQAQRTGNRLGVLFLDLDDFKMINDSLGHDSGDHVLAVVAERLLSSIRRSDIACRLGGDEFAVVLTNLADDAAASRQASTIIAALAIPVPLEEREIFVSVSVGVAVGPEPNDSAQKMLNRSDRAMYEVKRHGKNGFRSLAGPPAGSRMSSVEMVTHLRRALARGGLFLEFQPQFEIATTRIVAVEALLRCRSKRWGVLQPNDFIPIAERSGLIHALGRWVILEACKWAARWKADGCRPVRVAVNVSAHQFADPTLLDVVADALAETSVEPHWLELELTESLLLETSAQHTRLLGALHELGVHLTVDDFGTGCNTLARLPLLPIQRIKMDRSFLSGLTPADDRRGELIGGVIALTNSLGLEVVAEGVETREQLEIIVAKGARLAQGFYFSEPLGATRVPPLLRGAERPAAQREKA